MRLDIINDLRPVTRGELRRILKIMSDDTVAKIAEIKTDFDSQWKTVNDKVLALEQAIQQQPQPSQAVTDALADLKAHIQGAQVS